MVSFRFWRINIISNIFRTFHIVLEENYIAIIIVIELSPSPSVYIYIYIYVCVYIQTRFQKSWDTVQIVNKKGMQ